MVLLKVSNDTKSANINNLKLIKIILMKNLYFHGFL